MAKMFVFAPGIHVGGGKTLLYALLDSLDADHSHVFVDERLELPSDIPSSLRITRVGKGMWARVRAEFKMKKMVQPKDRVLFFSNLPPLSRFSCQTSVFVQNRLTLGDSLNILSWKGRIPLIVSYIWIKLFNKNATEFVVQTPSMKELVRKKLGEHVNCRISPLLPRLPLNTTIFLNRHVAYDFIYVSSAMPHKNHEMLFQAWKYLAEFEQFPRLCLVSAGGDTAALKRKAEELQNSHGLKITVFENKNYREVIDLYSKSQALIFPSLCESFGLPLVEAEILGMDVVASELDYVRDVVKPRETFDPLSHLSVARAVMRYLGNSLLPIEMQQASTFVEKIKKAS